MGVEKVFVKQVVKKFDIDGFLKNVFERAEISKIETERTPLGTRIIIYVGRPGLAISRLRKFERDIIDTLKSEYKIDNPMIDIREVENPYIDARIVAYRIKKAIERGIHYKKVSMFYLDKILQNGAVGAEIRIAGKVLGKERSAVKKFTKGYILHTGNYKEELVDTAYAQAFTKPGIVGIQVKILKKAPEEFVFEKRLVKDGDTKSE